MMDEVDSLKASEQVADPLRDAFVGMLFALAAAQVAVNAATVVSRTESFHDKLPAYSHLTLALLVIAVSWFGWSRSRSPGRTKRITSVFSRLFLGLLVDVVLVILYFIIVQKTEGADEKAKILPSAMPESQWLAWVFAVYAIWDLLTDIFVQGGIPCAGMQRIKVGFRASFVSSFCSVVCLLMVLLVYFLSLTATTAGRVIALDVALCSVVFFFRALKGVEWPLAVFMRVDGLPAFSPPRRLSAIEQAMGGVCFLCYFLILTFWWS